MAGKVAQKEGAAEGKKALPANPRPCTEGRLGESRHGGKHGVGNVVDGPNVGRTRENVRVPNVRSGGP